MRYVCPRILKFELTNKEVEMGIAYNEIERRIAEDLHGIYKPITKERKRVENITEKLYKNKK